jgi:hypothetical protein
MRNDLMTFGGFDDLAIESAVDRTKTRRAQNGQTATLPKAVIALDMTLPLWGLVWPFYT